MNLKALRPKSIRILGRDYKVTYRDMGDYGAFGLTMPSRLKIDIHNDQHPVEEQDTVLHETLHGLWYLMDIGHPEEEETIVRKLATGLIQVIKDNPKLVKYLTADVK